MDFKLSYNWLREFVETSETPVRLARSLSLSGPSVDRTTSLKNQWKDVVIGLVLSTKKHPKADRLSVNRVDTGGNVVTIVCGAPNVQKNMLVVVALPGAMVQWHGDGAWVALEPTTIRGVRSEGMMVAANEIGLAGFGDPSGIMDVSALSVKQGATLVSALDADDTMFDVEITSNRIDAFSVAGIAREAAVILGSPLTAMGKRAFDAKRPSFVLADDPVSFDIRVRTQKNCPRFSAVAMTNVHVGPSPLWMQLRLVLAGLRPINNIVDMTNYIMLEYGKPLHAYDMDRIAANSRGERILEIRPATAGETVATLDGGTHELTSSMVVAADRETTHGLAGIMGGAVSAISGATKTVLLESAVWDPVNVRQTARALGTRTDAVQRFEKGMAPEATIPALVRAVELTQELASGRIASTLVDRSVRSAPSRRITLREHTLTRTMGISIPASFVKTTLTRLGFTPRVRTAQKGDRSWSVAVPWWRARDATIEADLVEEIARIYGYQRLPSVLPDSELVAQSPEERHALVWERRMKRACAAVGWTELMGYSFLSRDALVRTGLDPDRWLHVENPLNEEMVVMRPSLTPSLLLAIAGNQSYRERLRLFELSRVYRPRKGKLLPEEPLRFVGAVVGDDPFREVKGMVEYILDAMGFGPEVIEYRPFDEHHPWCIPEKSRAFRVHGVRAGYVAIPRTETLRAFGIKKAVAMFHLRFQDIVPFANEKKKYTPLPKYPAVERDLAIIVSEKTQYADVVAILRAHQLVLSAKLFDVYAGEHVATGKKSMAFHLRYRSDEKTLTGEEVDKAERELLADLKTAHDATLRVE